jgi:hypothetical protein
MKWQNPLFMERIQIEHGTLLSTELSSQESDCIEFGGVGKIMKNATNKSELCFSYFGILLCPNCPAIKERKYVRIWSLFPTWIGISKDVYE